MVLAMSQATCILADMQPTSTPASEPSIRLRREKLDELRRANGIETEVELARIIGVSPTTLWRISEGKTAPSQSFIARALVAFPHVQFATLFAIERSDQAAA